MTTTTTTTVTLASHAAFVASLNKGQTTAEALRAHVAALIASEATIKAELGTLTIKAIKARYPRFYHADKKDGMIRETFYTIVEQVVLIKSFSYALFSSTPYTEILRGAAEKLTDEDIAAHARSIEEAIERRKAKIEALVAARSQSAESGQAA